jgi:hypothetical protein
MTCTTSYCAACSPPREPAAASCCCCCCYYCCMHQQQLELLLLHLKEPRDWLRRCTPLQHCVARLFNCVRQCYCTPG